MSNRPDQTLDGWISRALDSTLDPQDRDRAWGEVTLLLQNMVRAWLRPGDRRIAESMDICQDLLAHLQSRDIPQGLRENPTAYLRTALKNRLRTTLGRCTTPPCIIGAEHIANDSAGPATVVLRVDEESQEIEVARRLVDALDEQTRHIVLERGRGVPYETIADQLQLSPVVVRQRMSRTIAYFRQNPSVRRLTVEHRSGDAFEQLD